MQEYSYMRTDRLNPDRKSKIDKDGIEVYKQQ
jgi:hypothetical protein